MMTKKLSVIFAVVVLLAGAGFYLKLQQNKIHQTAAEEAIKQAREFRPEGFCTQALVPAVHEATGAKYTFPSGCLAPGWKAEQ